MSIFQNDDQSGNGNATTSKLNDLVGEGKKFKTVDDLANGKLEADRFIEQLQNEQRELRIELEKALAKKDSEEQPPRQESREPPERTPSKQPQSADITSEVEKVIQKREAERSAQSNMELVTSRMIETYGDEAKAAEVIKTKSRELDMTPQELQKLAMERPKAFFKMIGLDDSGKAEVPKTTSHPSARSGAALKQVSEGATVKPGTYKWYQELRRSDPNAFFSPRIQNQMDRDAREKGQAFYS